MLELPHTVIGALIGTKIKSPLVSLPLALLSHFLIDLIPHWNPSIYTENKETGQVSKLSFKIITVDTLLSLIFGLWAAFRFWPDEGRFLLIIFCCFVSVLPDVAEAPYFFFKFQPSWLKRWIEFQHRHQSRTTRNIGLLIEVFTVVTATLLLF